MIVHNLEPYEYFITDVLYYAFLRPVGVSVTDGNVDGDVAKQSMDGRYDYRAKNNNDAVSYARDARSREQLSWVNNANHGQSGASCWVAAIMPSRLL